MKRQLGVWAAAAMVVANMIGSGVFTSAGFQAKALHDPITMLLTWVVGAVFALCGAAAYGELGAMMPRVGGEYVYLRRAYHPVVGVMSGWASLFAGFSAPIAAAALLFSGYLGSVLGIRDPSHQMVIAIALIVAMTALHAVDTVVGGRVQTVFSAAKVLLIAGFVGLAMGFGHGDWSHVGMRDGGPRAHLFTTSFAVALMYVSFAYSGWNAAAYIAGEIDQPQRNLPRALLAGTALVSVLYVLLNVVFLYAVPAEVLGAPPMGPSGPPVVVEVGDAAARALFGPTTGRLISTLIALALLSTVSAMVMAGPRVVAAMAEDGALPPGLGKRTRRGAPMLAVLVQGGLAIAFVLVGELGQLIRYVGFTLTVFTALTVGGVFVLRFRRPSEPRPFRTWGYPVTPAAFVGLSLWIAYAQITEHPMESLAVLATLVSGGIVYLRVISPSHGSR